MSKAIEKNTSDGVLELFLFFCTFFLFSNERFSLERKHLAMMRASERACLLDELMKLYASYLSNVQEYAIHLLSLTSTQRSHDHGPCQRCP